MNLGTTPGGKPTKRCWTCGDFKHHGMFPSRYARRCKRCINLRLEQAMCRNCGENAGLGKNGEPRKYCAKPDCTAARMRDVGQVFRDSRKPKTRKLCPACGVVKPLVVEHWSPRVRDADGTITSWDGVCTPCKAADQRQRYLSDAERRRKAQERTKAYAQRVRERRAADPEFNARYLAQRREQARRQRERRARTLRIAPEPAPKPCGDLVPAAPIARAIMAEAKRSGFGVDHTDIVSVVCERAGTSARRLSSWRTGEATHCRLDIADRVLVGLDLLWWEVWPPEEFPEVARIFEPEGLAA